MESGVLLGVTIWYAICLVDLHTHNKKVDELFSGEDQFNLHRDLHIGMYGFYILLAILIFLNIRNFIAGIV